MPQGAADSLIGVFQNITANKFRQKELDQQTLESIARQHYEEALAKHQEDLTQIEQKKLDWEMDPNSPKNVQAAASSKRADAALDAQQRLSEKDIAEADRRMQADASRRWKDAMTEHLQGGNPGLIAGGLPESERQRFLDSIRSIQKHEYETKKAASDAQLAEQVAKLRQSVPDTMASSSIFGGITAGMPEEVEKQLIPQIGQMTVEAAKKLGPPPGPDDVFDYQHPAYREKIRMDDQKIKTSEQHDALMHSQEERNKLYLKVEPDLAKATVELKKAQTDAAKEGIKVRKDHEKYFEKFGDAKITHEKAMEEISRTRARAALNKSERGSAFQLEHAIRAVATVDLRNDYKEQSALKKQQVLAKTWLDQHKEFESYKEVEETVGDTFAGVSTGKGRKVTVIKKPDGSPIDETPGLNNNASEKEKYLHFKALQRDWGHDAEKDESTSAGRLKALDTAIKNDHQMATVGASIPLDKMKLPDIGQGLTKAQKDALDATVRSKTRKRMKVDDFTKSLGIR